MNAQDLKNSILQLAIQGKLVEQREEEGTAKELLKKIEAEKKQQIKEGKIKKQKTLPEIKVDEIPFDIPESWEWVRLGELISISSGKGLTSKQMLEGDVPVFGGNGVTGYHNTGNVDKETVVIGRVGYYCGSVHITPAKAWITDNAFITTYPENHIDRSYLVYILSHLNLGRDNNATAQPVVSGKKIYPILFPLPPLEEQKRIVAKIEELMPYVDKYDVAYCEVVELNKKFPKDMQKSILQYAIQGKLVEQREEDGTAENLYKQIQEEKKKLIKEGKIKKTKALPEVTEDEIPFDIPKNWKWVRFGEIVNFNMGKTPPRSEVKYWKEDYNWVSIADMVAGGYIIETKEKISEAALADKFKMLLVPKGTLLMSFKLTVGKVSVLDIDAVHNEAIISIYPYSDIENSIRNYLFTTLPQLSTYGDTKGAIKGKTLNSTSLNNLLIPLPPLPEQKRIVEKIEDLLPYTKQLIKKVN